ncbi:MAG TPA: carboxypeptidase regulatory-like domain-containing protein, partial [Blastocatellia bacterium]|nr:carboxypeptidase regulatory-like domain-containing protein [Blastocatellia bacterium]
MLKKTTVTMLSLLLAVSALPAISAHAQGAVELRGTVTDETKAYIPAAPVVLEDAKGQKFTAQTDELGRYRFTGLQPGVYTITVEVEGFAKYTDQVDLTAKRNVTLDIALAVFISDQVEVKDDAAGISTEPDKNLSAITLSGVELEALPDDPDELLDTLKQMAGGAEDASVYVGGFREDGRIPPREAIQMIRINANPFAAEFSEPGRRRIEIVTKPGSDTYHGSFRFNFNDESLNARDPFSPIRAPLQVRDYGFNFTGPIIKNRWGFFADFERREFDENEVVNATILNPATLQPELFSTSVLTPRRGTDFSIRTDYLATSKHTLGFQYRFEDDENLNFGGGFDLPERGSTNRNREHSFRFSLTTIVTENAVNEARFEFERETSNTRALTDATAINVLDAFNAGGAQDSLFQDDITDEYEFSNNLTYTYKRHTIKAGFRAEGERLDYINRSNFGGTFTFGTDFERDAQGQPVLDGSGNMIPISSLELYRRVVAGVPGYRPSQFSIVRGDPAIQFSQVEMGWFVQDDWRVSERLTLSYGVRHEFQTNLVDKMNFAPRFGLAWNPDKDKKGVVRFGAGVFYDYLDDNITFNTLRFDGVRQQQFVIQRPSFFPEIPDAFDENDRRRPTIRVKSEGLNAPYTILSTVSYERQLSKNLIGTVNYSFIRGLHLLRSRNINAPVPGSALSPFPDQGPILEYESTGRSRRHELQVGLRANFGRKFMMSGFYTLSSTKSDTDGAGTNPADPYNLAIEYGRAGQDVRHRIFVGGSVSLPWNMRVSPFIIASSGRPFNITTGRDNNRDTLFTDRPAFANPGDPEALVTPFGVFNPNPQPGDEIIPRNFGDGPGFVNVNLNLSKTFGFGSRLAGFGPQAQGG